MLSKRGSARRSRVVVDGGFEQRLGHALCRPAVDFAGHDHGVHDRAAVVGGDQAPQVDVVELGVDLDHRQMRAEGIGALALLEVLLGGQARVAEETTAMLACYLGGQIRPGESLSASTPGTPATR